MGNPEKAKRTAPKSAGGTAEGRFLSKNDSHSIANQRSSDNIFQTIKSKVTTREAAEFYGLKIGRNGMACCPFHPDRNPSLKVDERFHCFGCGADGDVIDYAAKLFHLIERHSIIRNDDNKNQNKCIETGSELTKY